MVKIKIWTKKELRKGYMPSDKVTFRGVRFEDYGLNNFGLDHDIVKELLQDYMNTKPYAYFIKTLKSWIVMSDKFKQMEAEDYHTHIYLNLNNDGVDCFISR